MKRSNEPLATTLKSSLDRGGSETDSRGGEQKKSGGNKGNGSGGDGKKDQSGKKSSGGRQVKEQDSPAKRSVGRPPKRAAVSGNKRNRESVDSETMDSKQTKKKIKEVTVSRGVVMLEFVFRIRLVACNFAAQPALLRSRSRNFAACVSSLSIDSDCLTETRMRLVVLPFELGLLLEGDVKKETMEAAA
ncbi:hypothetical protein R6Q57_004745 [Mikania cordata]